MINIIKDVNLYDHMSEYDVTLVGTNTYYVMSGGLQRLIMLNNPYVMEENLKTKYGDPEKLGTLCECKAEGEPTICLCYVCKVFNCQPHKYKEYGSYEAIEKCLRLANIRYKGMKVASPVLGASPFDGNCDKEKVMEIIHKAMADVDLTIYDYHQQSRAEMLKEFYLKEQAVRKVDYKAYRQMVAKRKAEAEERFRKNGRARY